MARHSKRNEAIPHLRERKQRSGRVFYYFDHGGRPRQEEPLGCDRITAMKRWAEIMGGTASAQAAPMFREIANQYRACVIPTKAPRTQADNIKELVKLLEFFDDPPAQLEAIKPLHVRQYLDWRRDAPVRANREKALLSHIWNFARDKGYTNLANPCAGIKGYKERGRDVYIEDEQYFAIRDQADEPLQDAMDLGYLIGQRPSDVLKVRETDIRDGMLVVKQGKTGAKVRIEIRGDLAIVIKRILARKSRHQVYNSNLIVNEHGRAFGVHALSERFKRAANAAGIAGVQFRDLRAKAATDKAESSGDIRQAQKLMAHATIRMTEHYVRQRLGERITPAREELRSKLDFAEHPQSVHNPSNPATAPFALEARVGIEPAYADLQSAA